MERKMLKSLQERISWLPLLRRNNQRGISMIESILAMVVLSLGFWGSYALITQAMESGIRQDARLIATQLASREMEKQLLKKHQQGFDELVLGTTPEAALEAPYQIYKQSLKISNYPEGSTANDFKKLDVTVRWGDEGGNKVTLTTLVSQYENI
jgi:Tfp pilus assembly protein PilV